VKRFSFSRRRSVAIAAAAVAAFGILASAAASGTAGGHHSGYVVHNLVSNDTTVVPADRQDPNLVNAWGLTAGPTPWWVANNGTDTSTLYDGNGAPQPQPPAGPLVVSVPGAPTGAVFNGTGDFVVTSGAASGAARFLFATESGTIRGWSPAVPPPSLSHQTEVGADRSGVGAVYKGLATGSVGGANFLYATDFHNGRIDVFDRALQLVTMPGGFVDRHLPTAYAPFGIQNIGGNLFVTFAKRQAGSNDEAHGPGLGFVDEFSTDGHLLARVATRGPLDAPWGLALAPANFGRFSGDLLVGNFGDGKINAYRLDDDSDGEAQFEHAGELTGPDHRPIVIDGLWGLGFGNGAASGATNALYFTAGPNDEADGLFGRINAQ
jgi:uncharacterized protein (TIGR03118 family)